MASRENSNKIKLYAITDGKSLPGGDLKAFVIRAVAAGVDMVQIREKNLTDRELSELVGSAVATAGKHDTKILVNDRIDISLAAGADGVHLGGHSAPQALVRDVTPDGFLIGASTHNLQQAREAANSGVDFITFGPVFHTLSKARYGPPVGLKALEEVCESIRLPVFPLGGISESNYSELLELPIAGIAGISIFQNTQKLDSIVRMIKANRLGQGI